MLVHSPHSALFAAFSGAGSLVTAYAASNFGQGPVPTQNWCIEMAGIFWGTTELALLAAYGASFVYEAIDETKEKSILAKGKRGLMKAFALAGQENMDKWSGAAAWGMLGIGNGFIAASALTTLMTVGTAGLAPTLLATMYLIYGVSGAAINAAKIYGALHRSPKNKIAKFMHDHTEILNVRREEFGALYYLANGCVDPNTTWWQTAGYLAGQGLTRIGYGFLQRGKLVKAQQQPTP